MTHIDHIIAATDKKPTPPAQKAGRFLRDRYALSLLLIAYGLLGLLYDITVPFFEKPDELKHFATIQYIQTEQQLPVVREGVYKPWDQEGTQPPLYHILAAALVSWLDLSDFEEPPRNPHYADERSFVWRERGNNNLYLHAPGENWSTQPLFLAARLARWLSLLAGLVTIGLTYLLAFLIFPASKIERWRPDNQLCKPKKDGFTTSRARLTIWRSVPLVAAALVAFIPQFVHVSSAITNDSLSTTLAAAALVLLTMIVQRGASAWTAVLLGLVLGLGAITKLSLLYLLPLSALAFIIDAFRARTFVLVLKFGGIIGLILSALAGWWYWRNWQLYGDPTALNAHLLYRGGALDPTPTLAQIWRTEMVGLELSFWAAFGAGQVLLEPWLYELLGWIKYVGLAGVLLGVWSIISSRRRSDRNTQFPAPKLPPQNDIRQTTFSWFTSEQIISLGMLIVWVLVIFAALLRWMQITPASWGRLLYPALPAAAVLLAWGLSQLSLLVLRLVERLPRPFRLATIVGAVAWPWLIVAGLFGLALISPFRYIQPAYAKTPLITEGEIPAAVTELNYVYIDEKLRLLGYQIEQPAVQPGEWLPVTLYWQATAPIAKNYTTFVKLLDQAGDVVAQTNTYPDGGKWPTSMLVPGKVLPDTYHIRIPLDVDAPLATRLTMGIFEFDDPQRAAKTTFDATGQIITPIVEGVPIVPNIWPALDPSHPLVANFGDRIRLTGIDWADPNIKPGSEVPLIFYWETLSPPGQNLNLFIHLIDPDTQNQIAGFDSAPDYPTGLWQAGNTLIDRRMLNFPADIPPGDYELYIGWYNLDDFARLPLRGDKSGDALKLLEISVEYTVK